MKSIKGPENLGIFHMENYICGYKLLDLASESVFCSCKKYTILRPSHLVKEQLIYYGNAIK